AATPCAPSEQTGYGAHSIVAVALSSQSTTPEVIGAGDHVTTSDAHGAQDALAVARTASPDTPVVPGDLLFQRLLKSRIVFLGQQVDEDIANRLCAEILLL